MKKCVWISCPIRTVWMHVCVGCFVCVWFWRKRKNLHALNKKRKYIFTGKRQNTMWGESLFTMYHTCTHASLCEFARRHSSRQAQPEHTIKWMLATAAHKATHFHISCIDACTHVRLAVNTDTTEMCLRRTHNVCGHRSFGTSTVGMQSIVIFGRNKSMNWKQFYRI